MEKQMFSRFDGGICRVCSGEIKKGDTIMHDESLTRGRKTRHASCDLSRLTHNALLDGMSKEQVIDVMRRVTGSVGDTGRTSIHQYIVALGAPNMDQDKVTGAINAVLGRPAPDHLQAAMTAVAVDPQPQPAPVAVAVAKPEPAAGDADALARIIRNIAGQACNEERVRELIGEAITALPAAAPAAPREIIIRSPEKTVTLDEHTHPLFDEVLAETAAGQNVMLVGPAGCGKSFLAAQVAKARGLKYGAIHCSAGMSEAQILGYLLPTGDGGRFEYRETLFVTLVIEGNSLFLFDELDAADPNVPIVVNGIASSDHLIVPQRLHEPVVKRGDNFSIMAACNTYGTGANRIYAGRNPLDGATVDRFYIIEMDYDVELEKTLAPAYVLEWVWNIRAKVQEHTLRRVVSTRMIQKAAISLSAGAKWESIQRRLLAGWTADELAKIGR